MFERCTWFDYCKQAPKLGQSHEDATVFKQSTCPCTQHVISRGGNQWQLRPVTTVPPEVVLKLPTVSNSIILKKRAARKTVTDQAA